MRVCVLRVYNLKVITDGVGHGHNEHSGCSSEGDAS